MTEGTAMYRQVILEHYRNPARWGEADPAHIRHEGENPLCGDVITVTLTVADGSRVAAARFTGRGCAISQASADILMEHLEGMTLDAVVALDQDQVIKLLGIQVTPVRVKCAILPMIVARDGVRVHRGEREARRSTTEAPG